MLLYPLAPDPTAQIVHVLLTHLTSYNFVLCMRFSIKLELMINHFCGMDTFYNRKVHRICSTIDIHTSPFKEWRDSASIPRQQSQYGNTYSTDITTFEYQPAKQAKLNLNKRRIHLLRLDSELPVPHLYQHTLIATNYQLVGAWEFRLFIAELSSVPISLATV